MPGGFFLVGYITVNDFFYEIIVKNVLIVDSYLLNILLQCSSSGAGAGPPRNNESQHIGSYSHNFLLQTDRERKFNFNS